jgi:hypothetical protein
VTTWLIKNKQNDVKTSIVQNQLLQRLGICHATRLPLCDAIEIRWNRSATKKEQLSYEDVEFDR